jgi:flagellar protein FlgJ
MDFSGLGELKGQAQKDQGKAVKQAAQQFEGLFIQMMLKSMRDATPKDESKQSSAIDTFQGMFDQEVSTQMAKRSSIGVANFLTHALDKKIHPASTSDVMKARENINAGYSLQPAPQTGMSLQNTQPALDIVRKHGLNLNATKKYGRGGS